jgi:hypothetical protein
VFDDFLIIGRGSRGAFPMKASSRNAMVVHLRVWKLDCGEAVKWNCLFADRTHAAGVRQNSRIVFSIMSENEERFSVPPSCASPPLPPLLSAI